MSRRDTSPLHTTTPLITALLHPDAYCHPVSDVDLIETHISWVLLAGDYDYKLKRPVVLPFLDFGTLAARRRYCEDEVRLNRRLAPQVYLGGHADYRQRRSTNR